MNTTKNPMEVKSIEEGKEIGMFWMQKFYYSLFEGKALKKILEENSIYPTMDELINKMNLIEKEDFAQWEENGTLNQNSTSS
jgi:hypothetical protein